MPASDILNNNSSTDVDIEEIEDQVGNAYNNVNLSGAGTDLEFFTPNGGSNPVKSITLPSGGGGGTNFEAFNSVSESNGVYTFGTNHGNVISTTIDIGGIATNAGSITSLNSTVTDIKNLTGTSTLKTTVDDNTDDITNIKNLTGTSTLKTTVSGHTTDIATNASDISTLNTTVSNQTTDISTLNSTVSGHTTDIATNASDISTLNTTVSNQTTDISTINSTLSGHTTDIDVHNCHRAASHPDLGSSEITADSVTVNGRTYVFNQSSYEWHGGGSHTGFNYGRNAFKTGITNYWETETVSDHEYETLDSGDLYNYSGTSSLDGIDGEWISIQFPEPICVKYFKMRRHHAENAPHKFRLLCSNDGTNWNRLDCFDESGNKSHQDGDDVSSTSNSIFYTSTDDNQYGIAYTHWAIVVTQIKQHNGLAYNLTMEEIKFYSVPEEVAKLIKANDENFNDASITQSGGTYYLNLERNDGENDVQLPLPTGGTAAGFNPAAIEVVTYGNTSTANSKPFIETTTQGNTTTEVELFDGFVSAVKDGDNIKLTTEAGNETTVGPFATTSVDAITLNFTVQTVSGNNKYFLHGSEAGALPIELNSQHKYIFTFPAAHPLKLSLTADGTHGGGSEYTAGVTYDSTTQLTFVNNTLRTLANLYYYCSNHANMGGAIIEDNGFNNITSITYDSSVPKLEIERAFMDILGSSTQGIPLSDSFVSAQKDGDNIKLTSISGAETSVGPFSGSGGGASSSTQHPTSAMTSNGGFSGVPPSTITFATTPGWTGLEYRSYNVTSTSVEYKLHNDTANGGAILSPDIYALTFEINGSQLILDVDPPTTGSSSPAAFDINGGSTMTSGAVSPGDTISLYNPSNVLVATMTVPTELSVSTPITFASTSYNLFTDQLFDKNSPPLGRIGELNATGGLEYWGYDSSDGTVIVAHEYYYAFATNLRMSKITLAGDDVPGAGRYVTNPSPSISSLSDLIHHYNNPDGTTTLTFTKHALFDLAVNNSPAYLAFDEDDTTQWVSHSNRYDTVTGDALQTRFSGTPPSAITLGGYWHTGGGFAVPRYYAKNTSDETTTFVRYILTDPGHNQVGPNYGIAFYIDTNNDVILDTDWSVGGSATPLNLKVNGGSQVTSSVVQAGDFIELMGTGTSVEATLTVPTEFSVVVESKLSSTTDVGEYITVDLGSAVEATTLTLKSVSEYKEPRINMTDYNQGGYEVSASSEYTGSNYEAWQVFDNLLTGDPDYGASHNGNWVTAAGTYVLSGSDYVSTGTQLSASSSTVTGEWLKLKLPDKRKAVGYKLSRQNHTDYSRSPRQFRLYGSNDDSTWTEIVGSAQTLTTTPLGSYDQAPETTGGTRFDFTASNAYQYFALVIEKCWAHTFTYLMEFQLFCQPSEIEEFKLYGSPDNSSWTEISDVTSANITPTGTEFTIDTPGSYQHYGLVVTKNYGYHNVSLGELKLGVEETVDLSNYYKKTELDPRIAKAKGTFFKGTDALSTGTGPVTLKNAYKVTYDTQPFYNGILTATMWGGLNTTYSIYDHRFTFESGLFNDDEEYQVILTPSSADIGAGLSASTNRVMSMEILKKDYQYFEVRTIVWEDTANYGPSNLPWGFDFVVF